MLGRYLFDEDDYRASPALISRTAANILKRPETFGFLEPATLDALQATASEIGDDQLEAATGLVCKRGKRRADRPKETAGREELVALLDGLWRRGRGEPRLATISQNAELVGNILGLTRLEHEVLFLRLACEADRAFSTLADNLREKLPSVADTMACLAGASPVEVRKILSPEAQLRRAGILSLQPDNDTLSRSLALLERFEIFAAERFETVDEVSAVLLGPELSADLKLAEFSHVAGAELAAKVLRGALDTRERGVNILLYGPPGTGKTELARCLAAEVGAELHSVCETDRDGDEPSRHERLGELKLFQHILSLRGGGLCLFDEAEDLFSFSLFSGFAGSKVFMNRLFETNRVPVIWIANEVEALSPTVRRRITFAVNVDMPPASRRGTILVNLSRDAVAPSMPSADLERLMRDVPVTPGVAAKAVQATRLAQGDASTLETVTRGLAQALRDGVPVPVPRHGDVPPFDPALANADIDLSELADRLTRSKMAFSLSLHGPSGTGKSAYARYLAERMGMPVQLLRGSDLLGPFVGQTERQIREAFDAAERDGAFLILDEVDGLLSARAEARQRWELTQVNELLMAMEAHRLPFAVTTNLAERIDPAARRRLDFHVRFETLTSAKAYNCWRHFLSGKPPESLARLSGLTPAHFAGVRKKAAILGETEDAAAMLRRLAEEADPGRSRAVGFLVPVGNV